MGILNRIFKVGQAEAHSLVDKIEDPIKLTEQGIRDLKKDLDGSLKALAEVKAISIRSKQEMAENQERAKSFESKAILLLKRAQEGQLDGAEADRLATEALNKKEEAVKAAALSKENYQKLEGQISQLNQNVNTLKSKISHYENELKMLKARAKVSKATTKLNKSMANIDSGGTISMLEKMKDKVAEQEAMAEAYGDIANTNKSLDDEIDAALDGTSTQSSAALDELKAKLNQK
jgi:phage shock protein A